MVTESKENPLVDVSNVTVAAYSRIKDKQKNDKNLIFGRDDTLDNSPVNKVKVKAWTQVDNQTHTYFHSLSIDKQVEDFMGTAELRCRYDSELMEYWEPIRQTVVIYGSNRGDYKILFIGRVREVRQEGYEMCIVFQDYGWKFKQLVTQSYANDNVINKDGYTIMKLMFEALKIDSWVISPAAKSRLQQVGIDEDGNLTLNKEKVEEMPDLLKRLQTSNPKDAINKWTVKNKAKESELHNIKNINYTLKYEKPTPVMKKIASEGDFTSGKTIYANPYSSPTASGNTDGTGGSSASSGVSASGTPRPPSDLCSSIGNEAVISAMKLIWSYNRGYANDYSSARSTIINYATNSPQTYSSRAAPCLSTLSKYCSRSDGRNAAQLVKADADWAATKSGTSKAVGGAVVSTASTIIKGAQTRYNKVQSNLKQGNWGGAIMAAIFG